MQLHMPATRRVVTCAVYAPLPQHTQHPHSQLLKALAASYTVVIFDNMRTGASNDTGKAKLTIPMMADATAGLIQSIGLVKPAVWRYVGDKGRVQTTCRLRTSGFRRGTPSCCVILVVD